MKKSISELKPCIDDEISKLEYDQINASSIFLDIKSEVNYKIN